MPRPLRIWVPISGNLGNYHVIFKVVLGAKYLRKALYKKTIKELSTVKHT